jgi:hypothetical protein
MMNSGAGIAPGEADVRYRNKTWETFGLFFF